MNGLEAIKAMQEGKVVIHHSLEGEFFKKIIDGVVYVKGVGEPNFMWRVDTAFNFGGGYTEYNPRVTGWEKVENGIPMWWIACDIFHDDGEWQSDRLIYEQANYFSNSNKAEEIHFKQTLFRKLQRFSDENKGNEIDWTHEGRRQYFISFDYDKGKFVIDSHLTFRDFGQVYFVSLDVARKALEMFKGDLIKYFTHDWSKGE